LFGGKHFHASTVLCSRGYGVKLNSLVDTGAQGFLFLNSSIARPLSESLQVPIRRLPFKILVKGFQDQIQTPVDSYIRLHMRIDGRTIRNCPFVIMDLGSQDCIIGVKWLRQFRLQLDTYRNRFLWPKEYPATYDAAPPLLMTLAQPKSSQNVELDIARRDALWEQDEARRNQSPSINRIRGILRVPKPRDIVPCPTNPTDPPPPAKPAIAPVPPRTSGHHRIAFISANGLHFNMKRKENEFFTTTLYEIDRVLEYKRSLRDDPDNVNLLRDRLPPVYEEYRDVFSKAAADQLPKHRFYDHKIVLTEPLPNAYSALYKQSIEELEATKKYLQDNLEKGFIEHSRSPFASPILCVRKANGDLRVCVDYRKLNALTRKDAYPIPRIDELLSRPAKAKFFTKFDIRAAFNRIRMDPDSEEYTTFRTRYGTYKCKVLPFGLCNGPATYQRYMNDVLVDYLDDFCIAYLDDILIYSEDEVTHTLHVKQVLERLRQAGLHVDIKKSEFHVNRTKYLGYVLTSQGLEVDPDKVSILRDWKPPTTVTSVKSFLGFAGFYRQFVPEFSRVAKPLIMLQSPSKPFVWSLECQQAFDKVREALLAIPTLYHFHSELDTRIETDASDGVIAGVFSQKQPDGS